MTLPFYSSLSPVRNCLGKSAEGRNKLISRIIVGYSLSTAGYVPTIDGYIPVITSHQMCFIFEFCSPSLLTTVSDHEHRASCNGYIPVLGISMMVVSPRWLYPHDGCIPMSGHLLLIAPLVLIGCLYDNGSIPMMATFHYSYNDYIP